MELSELDQLQSLEALFAGIWEVDSAPITSDLMRALAHSGNYVVGAFAGASLASLIGGAVAFIGREPDGRLILHSHIVGVLPGAQARGTGFALKQHQRRWALDAGIEVVTWTFDPLVRRNAYFNLVKLGAQANAYQVNFYGHMDGINSGDESDRLVIRWRLDSLGAKAAAAGNPSAPDLDQLLASGAAVALRDDGGEPVVREVQAERMLCQVPDDIVAIRSSDLARALRWRRALRDTLGRAVGNGYEVSGITRSGWYVLGRV